MHYSELSIVSGCPLKGSAALGQRNCCYALFGFYTFSEYAFDYVGG